MTNAIAPIFDNENGEVRISGHELRQVQCHDARLAEGVICNLRSSETIL